MTRIGYVPLGHRLTQMFEPLVRILVRWPVTRSLLRVTARFGFNGRTLVAGLPYLWLLLFFLVPFAIVLKISLSTRITAQPPYMPLLEWVGGKYLTLKLDLSNYQFLFQDDLYWKAYLSSVEIAAISTVLCLLIAYPIGLPGETSC